MLDQTTPPFAVGDAAYARPAPGGYASAAAVPADPAYGGSDQAYAVPSLGGEFQPGSGKPTPTTSPISKGADADGGAADIAAAPRIDVPTPPAPVVPATLSATVVGTNIIFDGVKKTAAGTVTVTYQVNGDGVPRNVVLNVAVGDSAGLVAAGVAARMNAATYTTAANTSNEVRLGTKTPNVFSAGVPITCVIA